MRKFDLNNQRNPKGILIRFEMYKATFKFIDNIFDNEILKQNKNINFIFKSFLKKKLYSEFSDDGIYPLFCHNFTKKHQSKKKFSFFKVNLFIFFLSFNQEVKKNFKKILLIPNIFSFIKLLLPTNKNIYYIKINQNKFNDNNILIKYEEGFSQKLQSDFFWLDNNIFNSNLIIFFENETILNLFLNDISEQRFLLLNFNYEFNSSKLFKKKFANKYHFPSLKQKIFKFDSLFLNLLSNFY